MLDGREKGTLTLAFFVCTAPVVRAMERLRFLQNEKVHGELSQDYRGWVLVEEANPKCPPAEFTFTTVVFKNRLHRSRVHFHGASQGSSVF